MRLSDVLSKPISYEFAHIEGFLGNKKLKSGNSKKLSVGKVALNYYCKNCNDQRTFYSGEELFCIGVNDNTVSIDCVLECPGCGASVQTWFLLECENDVSSTNPSVRILKKSEKLSESVLLNKGQYGDFTDLLEKANRASRDGLGAGSIVYLRKVLEQITMQTADAAEISTIKPNGKRRPFKDVLEEVDCQRSIIPKEFSANRYRLFGDLSDVVHGDYDEVIALEKFSALYRLVVGVLDNVKNNRELMKEIGALGWNEGDTVEQA